MKSKQGLVATHIFDKNGKATTVYRKHIADPETAQLLPKPSVTGPTTEREVLLMSLSDKMDLTSEKSKTVYQRCYTALSTYSTQTLRLIEKVIEEPVRGWDVYEMITLDDISEVVLNDWCMLVGIYDDMYQEELIRYINGFIHYDNLEPQQEDSYPSKRLEQASAIIRVIRDSGTIRRHHTTTENPGTPFQLRECLSDHRLRDLLTGDNPQRVADIILERDLVDPESIQAVLDEEASLPTSLRNGTL